jgi:hypothetical protein
VSSRPAMRTSPLQSALKQDSRPGRSAARAARSFLAAPRRRVNLLHGQAPLHRARTAGELSRDSSRSQSAFKRPAVAPSRAVARDNELYRACEFNSRGTVAGGAGWRASASILPTDSRGGNLWRSPAHGRLGRLGKRASPFVRAAQACPGCCAARGTGAGSETISSPHYSRTSERRVRCDSIAVLAPERGGRVRLMEGDRLRDVFEHPVFRRSDTRRRDAPRVLD